MINLNTGEIKINNELTLSPWFTFEDFKKTTFFDNDDGILKIYLKKKQRIDNKSYFVGFFFRNFKLYMVSLMNDDSPILEQEEEPNRKIRHDEILRQYGIKSGNRYSWGKIFSNYDSRGNCSHIEIIYNN